jgi:hypothetical protein
MFSRSQFVLLIRRIKVATKAGDGSLLPVEERE